MSGPIRILILYPEITGYSLACWDALAAREDLELRVLTGLPGLLDRDNAFNPGEGRPWLLLLEGGQGASASQVQEAARDFKPDVSIVSGWSIPAFIQVVYRRGWCGCRIVVSLDTQLHRPVRQILGRLRLWRFLRQVDAFFVPGERGREFLSRWWRVPHAKIRSGLLAADLPRLRAAYEARKENPRGWPRSFHFVGRYVPIKGVPELLAGYRSYRSRVPDPMALRFSGRGILAEEIRETPGAHDLGFVQVDDMVETLADAGCFVLPSRYDAWGVALVAMPFGNC